MAVSRSLRTIRAPAWAVDLQWMRRRSSPMTYSRRDSNAVVAWGERTSSPPSGWARRPPAGGSTTCTRGWTQSVVVPARPTVRWARPSGSNRSTTRGPRVTTPRRPVGTVVVTDRAWPDAAAGSTIGSSSTGPVPTWIRSTPRRSAPPPRRRAPAVTVTTASAAWPTVTRERGSVRVISTGRTRLVQISASATATSAPTASTTSSRYSSSAAPAPSATAPSSRTRPDGVSALTRHRGGVAPRPCPARRRPRLRPAVRTARPRVAGRGGGPAPGQPAP